MLLLARRPPLASLGCLVLLVISACGAPPPAVDAGTDAGPPPADGGPPFACARPTVVEGILGDIVSVSFDTAMTTTRPRDLGIYCGNPEGEIRWAPQEVIELHVPGDGPVAVILDSTSESTAYEFNTVLQVRTECSTPPDGEFPPTCFDDAVRGEYRSRGAYAASGGDTLYIYVTGFSEPPAEQMTVDRGTVQVDIQIRANAAPTLSAGFFRLAQDNALIGATAADTDRDLAGIAMNFLGPDGALLDIFGDGEATMGGDILLLPFDPAPTTATWDQYVIVYGTQSNLAAYVRAVRASAVLLRVYDRGGASSEILEVPITEATLVGHDEPCDGMRACRNPMLCNAGTCGIFGAAASVCSRAEPIAIATPTDTATRARVTGSSGPDVGSYWPNCAPELRGGAIGAEKTYVVTVPAGALDLLATTNLPGTRDFDTILYLRRLCPDSGTELACNDNTGSDPQSTIEVRDIPAGTYTIFVERFGGVGSGSVPHELEVTLRPVLASGAACDMGGIENRCAAGTCTGGLCP